MRFASKGLFSISWSDSQATSKSKLAQKRLTNSSQNLTALGRDFSSSQTANTVHGVLPPAAAMVPIPFSFSTGMVEGRSNFSLSDHPAMLSHSNPKTNSVQPRRKASEKTQKLLSNLGDDGKS